MSKLYQNVLNDKTLSKAEQFEVIMSNFANVKQRILKEAGLK